MKQTAVEWLIDQMFKQGYFDGNKPLSITNLDHLQHQAKEMEKQQHGETWDGALFQNDKRGYNIARTYEDFDDYFAETYGSKGSDEHIEHNLDEIVTSSQTEISDDEIETESKRYGIHGVLFSDGAKWYREQLKNPLTNIK